MEKENERLLMEWKERLHLEGWTIKVCDQMRPESMAIDNCMGCCDIDDVNHAVRIEILDPKYYGERIIPFDYEKVLVHELLHIKMCLIMADESSLHDRLLHGILDEIAVALVGAKRSGYNEQPL